MNPEMMKDDPGTKDSSFILPPSFNAGKVSIMDILGEVLSIPVKRNETGALIRLTLARWEHVLDEHPHDFSYSDFEIVLDAIADPDYILRARGGARRAVVNYGKQFLHVFYRELDKHEGFIITAFYEPDFDRKLEAKQVSIYFVI